MPQRSPASRALRLTAVLAILGALFVQFRTMPAEGARQEALGGSTTPSVRYLFGSGSITGGGRIELRVELTGPAPAGGATVTFSSERPDLIPVPATVEVAAGDTAKTFRVTTNPSAVDVNVRVSAAYGGSAKGREVAIRQPGLKVIYVQSVIRGGGQGKVTVCLTGRTAAGGVTVALSSSDPATLPVPATVLVPFDRACVSFNVTASTVTEETAVRITATYRGTVRFRDTRVRDLPPAATATPTNTPTETATATETSTSTATATNTPEVPTNTATATATNTPEIATSTATSTATNTPEVPTNTATSTATNTPEVPTNTATSTATNTPEVPTSTPTSTATNTPEVPTSTATNTPEVTVTLAPPLDL